MAGSVKWPELFGLADQHGLQSPLHQLLSKIADTVPAQDMDALRRIYVANLHKSLLVSREMIRIIDCLRATSIEVLPYKGPALAESLYGDIALRQSGDIDLLVRPEHLTRIRELVGTLGYVPHQFFSGTKEKAYIESGYECAFDGPAGPNLLEVQWALQPKFYAVDFDMNGIFSRAVATSVTGYPIRLPSPEDLFLILSLHASKHVWGRLIWLCDIARILPNPDLNWEWIGSQATELGIARILRVTALLAKSLLGTPLPQAMETHLPEDHHADALAKEIGARIRSQFAFDLESFEYFRLMIRLRERSSDKLRFIRRLAFTPGPGEWACVHLPEALSPLYRFVRVSRLSAKIFRRWRPAVRDVNPRGHASDVTSPPEKARTS